MTTKSFIKTEMCYGREEKRFDICGFARAVADHLDGFEVVTREEHTHYPTVWLKKGHARITLRNGYGSKFGKIEFFASHDGADELDHNERSLRLKDVTIDGEREPSKVAADLNRRMISLLPDAIAKVDALIAKRHANVDNLTSIIEDLKTAFPAISITRRDPKDLTADVYYNSGGRYLYGSLDSDGRISIQRVSVSTAEDSRKLLAFIGGKEA